MSPHDKVIENIERALDVVMFAHYYPNAEPPTLDLDRIGFPTPRERAKAALVTEVLTRLDEYDNGSADTVEMLAGMCIDMIWLFHRRLCPQRSRNRPCMADASAVDTLIQALAMSTLAQELRTPLGETLLDIINAHDLDGDAQFHAVAAHVSERLHPRDFRRDIIPLQPGAPVIQFNAPFQSVDDATYSANRHLMVALAEAAEARGYAVEITSDYAYPSQGPRTDDHMVRSGVLRSAANVILITGGRTGTGRTLEAASIFMIPSLVLRHADGEEYPNPDRYSGDLSGQRPQDFVDADNAVRLLNEFLDTHSEQIAARHNNLVRWDAEPVGREGGLIMDADPSLFERSQLSRGLALFWAAPVHWPQAPQSVQDEIRRTVGIATAADPTATSHVAVGRHLSHRSLIAYAMLTTLSITRLGALWEAHLRESEPGPAARRAETVTMKVEDWAELDRRL